jgi:predicted transcriptional regulator
MGDPMTAQLTELQSRAVELAGGAFEAFCEDMSSMFGLEASCKSASGAVENFAGIKKRVPKLSAVHAVKADGALHGVFYLVFDTRSIFEIAGSVMMLPKPIILNHTKSGTQKDADGLRDAIQEVGNLLVGSWDRVFRENFEGHGHFVKGVTFIGEFQGVTKQEPAFTADGQYNIVDCEITVGDFPSGHCIVVFPQSFWTGVTETKPVEAPKPAEAAKPVDTAKPAETPKPAEAAKPAEEPKAQAETKQEPAADNAQKPTDAGAPNAAAPQEKAVEQPAAVTPEPKPVEKAPIEPQAQKPAVAATGSPVTPKRSLENIKLGAELSALTAGDIMNRCMVWSSPEDSVGTVQTMMQQHNTGYVLVGVGGVCQGIISRSNITGAVSPFLRPIFAKWRRPLDDASLQIKVKWIMSTPVHTVSLFASFDVIISTMCGFGGRCLPVLNADGKVVGIITVFDVFKILMNNNKNTLVIGEPIQSPPLV